MTKQEVLQEIKTAAEEYGFITEEANIGITKIRITEKEGHTVNFTISEDVDWDFENKKITVNLKVKASIATMGGNPTANDLLEQAQTIWMAGSLVKALENKELSYTSID